MIVKKRRSTYDGRRRRNGSDSVRVHLQRAEFTMASILNTSRLAVSVIRPNGSIAFCARCETESCTYFHSYIRIYIFKLILCNAIITTILAFGSRLQHGVGHEPGAAFQLRRVQGSGQDARLGRRPLRGLCGDQGTIHTSDIHIIRIFWTLIVFATNQLILLP